jgi:hypothetical protein
MVLRLQIKVSAFKLHWMAAALEVSARCLAVGYVQVQQLTDCLVLHESSITGSPQSLR